MKEEELHLDWMLHLLDILDDMLPDCMKDWKVVEARHAKAWSGTYRDVPLLKRNYNVLHRLQFQNWQSQYAYDEV